MRNLKVDESKVVYGLSTVCCWIRFFQCLLQIGYKLKSEKWQARGEDKKRELKLRKNVIQKAFNDELHLIIDRPQQGMGNSNDGNTARRFFENSETSARILGIDHDLMRRFHVTLQVILSGFNVKINLFEKYCNETGEKFISLYPWYPLTTTVHKVLMHGPRIVELAILPTGQLFKEAQVSRNKDVRNYRENYARKFSRKETMEDIFLLLLAFSDPLISNLRKAQPKMGKSLYPKAIALLRYEKFDSGDDNADGVID